MNKKASDTYQIVGGAIGCRPLVWCGWLVLVSGLAGCLSSERMGERSREGRARLDAAGWEVSVSNYDVELPVLTARRQDWQAAHPLVVYIEGDGRAWATRTRPSNDPTPEQAIGLQLAASHPNGWRVGYMAQPCQYVVDLDPSSRCHVGIWTQSRYSERVVSVMNERLSALKSSSADRLYLVGFSGGGTLAALLAARRSDVVGIVTVAGNLDILRWTDWHDVTPLNDALNPVDFAAELGKLPQVHWVGLDDQVVPPTVLRAFVERIPEGAPLLYVEQLDFDHQCCWRNRWTATWSKSYEFIESHRRDSRASGSH